MTCARTSRWSRTSGPNEHSEANPLRLRRRRAEAALHPCGKVQVAMREAGIEYDKVIGGQGHPIPFLRKGTRDELEEATGDTKLPSLKLADGTVLMHSKQILRWVEEQRAG